jgi:hypothetical protein
MYLWCEDSENGDAELPEQSVGRVVDSVFFRIPPDATNEVAMAAILY